MIGWLTGLSESPVAGVLLPLLFTLIAGAGGFHFSREIVRRPAAREALVHTARATVFFMLSCLLGVHLGILSRIGPEPQPTRSWSPTQVGGLSARAILQLSGISKKLQLLGVDQGVVRAFERQYAAEQGKVHVPAGSPSTADLDALTASLNVVSQELNTASSSARSPSLTRFRNNMPNYLGHLRTLRELTTKSHQFVPIDHYRTFLEAIERDATALVGHREGNRNGTVLSPAPSMNYIPLYALQMIIASQTEPLEDGRRRGDDDIGDEEMTLLDSAIKLSLGDTSSAPAVDGDPRRRYAVKH